jgi:four helix bundle protein
MPSNFRSLAAYQRARALADELREVSLAWSPFDRDSVGLQMVRAADSVGANIAEAGGRRTVKDKRHFLMIARGSLLETEHWLDCARARALIDGSYDEKVAAIARPLNGLIKTPAPPASQ